MILLLNFFPTNVFRVLGKRRYNIKLWKTFTDCFNCLPVAAVVDDKIFCMHGGLSPELTNLEQIRRIIRPTDVPDTGNPIFLRVWDIIFSWFLTFFKNHHLKFCRPSLWFTLEWSWQRCSRLGREWTWCFLCV